MGLSDSFFKFKDRAYKAYYESILRKNRLNSKSKFIPLEDKSKLEEMLFEKFNESEKRYRFEPDYIFNFLKNNFNKDYGIINPELFSRGMRSIYYNTMDFDYSNQVIEMIEDYESKFNSKMVNPANEIIKSLSNSIKHFFSRDESFLYKSKDQINRANQYYYNNDDFYEKFLDEFSDFDLCEFKKQYSNSLIDSVYMNLEYFDNYELNEIKSIINDSSDFCNSKLY